MTFTFHLLLKIKKRIVQEYYCELNMFWGHISISQTHLFKCSIRANVQKHLGAYSFAAYMHI